MSATSTIAWDAAVGAAGENVSLVGEVICWSMRGATPVGKVRAALTVAGFDEKRYCPDFKHRNVFARVAEVLERNGRIIKRLRDDGGHVHFQFNRANRVKAATVTPALDAVGVEVPVPDLLLVPAADPATPAPVPDGGDERFDFPFEDIITLGKKSGEIICKTPDFKTLLETEMDAVRAVRTANDVTNMVQRAFEQYGKANDDCDLFPIREGGGAYFVLAKHQPFLDQVGQFMDAIGGKLTRFPVPVGTESGNKSVRDTIEGGLANLIHELNMAIASLDDASLKGTIEKTAERIGKLKEKIKCYHAYLGAAQDGLYAKLAESNEKLKLKVLSIAGGADDDDEDEDDGGVATGAAEAVAGAGVGTDSRDGAATGPTEPAEEPVLA